MKIIKYPRGVDPSCIESLVVGGVKELKKGAYGKAYEQFRNALESNSWAPEIDPSTLTALRACRLYPHYDLQDRVYRIALREMRRQ